MRPEDIQNQRILISPLNWGWGHVARCIGLIDQLEKQGNKIFIACEDSQKDVFEQYFDNITYIDHVGYPFRFSKKGNFSWDLLLRYSSLKNRMNKERRQTEQIVNSQKIDLVISDHRYGFRSKSVPSIFVTHQFNLPLKWYEMAVSNMHNRMMMRFNKIWIIDYEDSRLAGKLSMCENVEKVHYVGPYSRFQRYELPIVKTIDKVLILSGPVIHAKQLLKSALMHYGKENLLVIAPKNFTLPEGINSIVGNWIEQDQVILNAKHIISRSGYSTILDLEVLKAKSSFFPTTGQKEQEYLFEWHKVNTEVST